MSTSILTFKSKYKIINDTMLILALHYFRKKYKTDDCMWFNDYLQNVVDVIIYIKPVGWADLKLDEYVQNDYKRKFLVEKINDVIILLNPEKVIDANEINAILRMKETEGYFIKESKLKTKEIISVLQEIILLISSED